MKKIIVLLIALSITLTFSCFGFAEEDIPESNPIRVSEEVELRETNADTYLMSDGTYECVVYADKKYFENEDGELVEIDNSIVNAELAIGQESYAYANKANSSIAHFANTKPAVYIESKDKHLSFEMVDAQTTKAIPGGDKNMEPISDYELSGENYITYKNIKTQTDLIYEVKNGLLKEYILLKSPEAPSEFSFEFDTNYSIEKCKDGYIIISDESGEAMYELGNLFAVDSAEAYTDDLEYTITEDDGLKRVSISISPEYLNASERVFPVLIDPSTMITGENNTYDSYVSSNHTSSNYYSSTYLKTGRSEDYHIRRSYIKFDIPSSVLSGWITASTLRIKKRGGVAPTTVKARRVISSWTSSGVTWSNKPDTATTGYAFSLDSDNWYEANVRPIVRKWAHDNKVNRGFELKDETESGTDHWTNFYSSDAASPNKPELHISYINVGSRPYQFASGTSANCMGYALEYKQYIDGSSLGMDISDMIGKNTSQLLSYTKNKSQQWMTNKLGSSNYSSIDNYNSAINTSSPGWFRVVLRVGFIDTNNNGKYDNREPFDYHWWYQTNENNGEWADKLASLNSSRKTGSSGVNPASLTWDNSGLEYNSAGVFYQIKDIRTITW